MEKIKFDSGIKEYRINGNGVLRFNPADPNLYARFTDAVEKIEALEQELSKSAREQTGQTAVELLKKADGKMKELLSWVFGNDNDFDKLLGGINLLAMGSNGQRVVTNLFDALQPVLLEGARSCTREQAQAAVSKAKARRAAQ